MNLKIKKYFYPLKKLSQNFLIDQEIIEKIVQFISPKTNQILVEIGPGLASLTKPICSLVQELIVIEIDPNLVNLLKKHTFYQKLKVFCHDALTFDYMHLFYQKKKLIRIFGNLPYHISTSLIFYLFKNINIIQDMNFMFQKEVAERLIATPGNKSYSRLSVIAQYYCDIKILCNISPKHFRPVPKVHSTFIRLTPHKNKYLYFTHDVNVLSCITKLAFQSRRKMLHHSLKKFFSKIILTQLNIDPTYRAENISVLQYCTLSNYIVKDNLLYNYFLKNIFRGKQ